MTQPQLLQPARVAVLIDAENVRAALWPAICAMASRHGSLAIVQCFGSAFCGSAEQWLGLCRDVAMEFVAVSGSRPGKNGADIALTIAAMDLIANAAVETICIVSSDSDFAPLAFRIRKSGLKSIGIGEAKSPERLKASFSHFDVLAPDADTGDYAIELLATIVRTLESDDGYISLPRLGIVLRRDHPELARQIGRGKLLRVLRQSGRFIEQGVGTALKIAVRNPSVSPHPSFEK